jgi:hypothetical protein
MPLPAMKFISKQAKVFYLVFEGAKQNLLPAGTHGVEQYRLLLDGIVKCLHIPSAPPGSRQYLIPGA